MNPLHTNDMIALSLLLSDDIYSIKEDVENSIPQVVIEKDLPQEIKAEPETKIAEPTLTFNYLGENNKYILIIVNEASADFLLPNDLGFLLKILAAKKLELNDVAILNLAKTKNADFDHLKDFFACNKIITFGINPQILGIVGAVPNKKSLFKDTPILGTWDLPKLQVDKSKKAIFWEELKTF